MGLNKMFDKFVYRNLEKYGNTVISEEEYNRLGEDKILKHLKRKGFKCKIKIYNHKIPNAFMNNFFTDEKDIIIEVLEKRCNKCE